MILFLFALSGAAGLVHEVAWSRALSQVLGGSLPATSIVLAVFLLGLGAGSAIASRIADRLARPLRVYAGLEAALALWAGLSPLLMTAATHLLERVGPAFGDGLPIALLRLAVAAALLLPPTMAMGATFPILVRACGGERIAILYGTNTLGAAAGALLGAFALQPWLGTRGSFGAAGALNLLVALAAWSLAWPRASAGAAPAAAPAGVHSPSRESTPRGAALPAEAGGWLDPARSMALLSGAVGALLQSCWTRIAVLAFGSSTYALGLTLAACIAGLGIGPLLVARGNRRRGAASPERAANAAFSVGILSLLILPLLGALPRLAAGLSRVFERSPPGALALQFALMGGLLLLPSMAQGACLPLLAQIAAPRRGAVPAAGEIYALSTWGSAAGFLLAGFLLVPAIGTRRTLILAAILALMMSLRLRPRRRLRALLVSAASLALLLLPAWDAAEVSSGGFLYGPIYRVALGPDGLREAIRRRGSIVYAREAGDGLVTVRRAPSGVLSLQINGKTEASSGPDLSTQLLAAHLPLLLHPAPNDALIIGLASGITLGAAERHPLRSIHAIEIARAVPGAARVFAEANHGALDDPRTTLVMDDARAQLLMRQDQYDVISSQPSNPWVAGVANLFTVEFYRLARARLRPHGVFCQWVQAYRIAPEDFRGIVGSFLEVFPDATLWEESAGGGDYFLIGGAVIDPHRLGTADAAVWEDLSRVGLHEPADLLARFVSGPRGLRDFAAGARRHTDDNLYLEWRAPLALFRDTLHDQTAALRGHREAVRPYLVPGPAADDPALAAVLRRRLRDRDARLAAAESLQDADRLALREPHLAAGIDLLRAGRYGEAAAALSSAATMSPDSPEAHFLLGLAYRGAGLPQAASIALMEAVRRDPTAAQAWNALGLCQQAEGQLGDASRSFEAALAAEPRLAVAHNNLGAVRIQVGDLAGAETALRAGLAEDPLLAAAPANLGLLFMRRGDPAGAESWYRRALELDPQNADARYNLANLMHGAGRNREAAKELEEILRADPQDKEARRLLTEVQSGGGASSGFRTGAARASRAPESPPARESWPPSRRRRAVGRSGRRRRRRPRPRRARPGRASPSGRSCRAGPGPGAGGAAPPPRSPALPPGSRRAPDGAGGPHSRRPRGDRRTPPS